MKKKRMLSLVLMSLMLLFTSFPVSAAPSFTKQRPKCAAEWTGVSANGKYQTCMVEWKKVSKADGYIVYVNVKNRKTQKEKKVYLRARQSKNSGNYYCSYNKIKLKDSNKYDLTFYIKGYRVRKNGKMEYTRVLKHRNENE